MRVTFRKDPRLTGLAAVGHPYQTVRIKVDKKVCGWIQPPSWQKRDWTIWLRVIKKDIMEDGNPNCEWINKRMKSYPTEQEARNATPCMIKELLEQGYTLSFEEGDGYS